MLVSVVADVVDCAFVGYNLVVGGDCRRQVCWCCSQDALFKHAIEAFGIHSIQTVYPMAFSGN